MSKTCVICGLDGDSEPATHFCYQCGYFLCDGCHGDHSVSDDCYSVPVSDEDSAKLHCSTHSAELLHKWCVPCQTLVCRLCLLKDHRKHGTQGVKAALCWLDTKTTSAAPRCRAVLAEATAQRDQVAERLQQQDATYEGLVEMVYAHTRRMRAEAVVQRDGLIGVLNKQHKLRKQLITDTRDALDEVCSKAQSSLDELDSQTSMVQRVSSIKDGDLKVEVDEKLKVKIGKCLDPANVWSPQFQQEMDFSLGKFRSTKYCDLQDVSNMKRVFESDDDDISMKMSSATYEFLINDFESRKVEYSSPKFLVQGIPWYISIEPPTETSSTSYGVYLCHSLDVLLPWSCRFEWKTSFINVDQQHLQRSREYKRTFSHKDVGYGSPQFITSEDLQQYLCDGRLLLRVALTIRDVDASFLKNGDTTTDSSEDE